MSLDAEGLALARRCRLRSVPKGGVIFDEGRPLRDCSSSSPDASGSFAHRSAAASRCFMRRALDACRRHPAIALGVIRTLAHRVRTFAGLVETLALRDVTTARGATA
jgi:hypothetical protein